VPGVPLAQVRPHTAHLLRSLGRRLGEMDRVLASFTHPAMRRALPWDLAQAGWAVAEVGRIREPDRRALVQRLLSHFDTRVLPALARTRTSVIHNDWNDYNVLVADRPGLDREVVGAIDFGDLLWSHPVCDLAIALTYAMLGKPDPVAAGAEVVAGYHEAFPLAEAELSLLHDLVLCRLGLSVTMAECQQGAAPDNEYLQISQAPVWALLQQLAAAPSDWTHYVFRDACGLPACPHSPAIVRWLERHGAESAPVMDPDPKTAPSVVLDLSVGSTEFGPRETGDKQIFAAALRARMLANGARLAIGRYDEPRLVYGADLFRHPGNDGPEWRTIHLGLDLFADAGTPVFAPFDGIVESVCNNAGRLDYGPTIILPSGTRPTIRA
jgi:hypothetical protein